MDAKYLIIRFRSSRLQIFLEIGFLKNFANFIGKYLRCSLFSIKLQAFSCEIYVILNNTIFDRTPLVAASVGLRFTS